MLSGLDCQGGLLTNAYLKLSTATSNLHNCQSYTGGLGPNTTSACVTVTSLDDCVTATSLVASRRTLGQCPLHSCKWPLPACRHGICSESVL
eukprot:jgi/Botrbrau1/7719/Bobra.0159s0151.1